MLKKAITAIANACGLAVMKSARARGYETRLAQAAQEMEQAVRERAREVGEWKSKAFLAERRLQESLAMLEQVRKQLSDPPRIVAEAAVAPGSSRPFVLDADANVARARQLLAEGDEQAALRYYAQALSLIHGYGPARQDLKQLSGRRLEAALASLAANRPVEARAGLVKAVELDPANGAAREHLQAISKAHPRRDLTKECYVYHQQARGEQVYREAFLRTLEYVAAGGITGEVLEFGVLAGYTARIICETMRDLLVFKQLHLFDSFEGLPEYTSATDAQSYEIAGRNVWPDRMRFPDAFVQELGVPIDVHVFTSLCEVISPERIFIYRGFFEETLKKPLPVKAALIHIDCDLYQSTKEVFERLYEMNVLQDGCLVLFDDYNCFKASPYAGERLAFREFLDGQGRFETTPFFTYGFNGAAFFLHEKATNIQAKAA